MRRSVQFAASAVMLTLAAGAVLAQDTARPSGVRFSDGDWTFVPVVKCVAGVWSTPGILALRRMTQVVGDNIVAIWYEHPVRPGGTWAASSWASQNQWDAITFTKHQFQISDQTDFMWPVSEHPQVHPVELSPPAPYDHGLLEIDPLATVPLGESRDELVSLLTQIGYQAADVSFEHIGECGGDAVLNSLAETAVLAASTNCPHTTLDAFFNSGISALCAGSIIPAPPDGFIPGTSIPLPGIPLHPLKPWEQGPQSPLRRPDCTTDIDCCYGVTIYFRYVRKGPGGLEYLEYCEATQTWSCPRTSGEVCAQTPTCPAPGGAMPDLDAGPVTCGHTIN